MQIKYVNVCKIVLQKNKKKNLQKQFHKNYFNYCKLNVKKISLRANCSQRKKDIVFFKNSM